MDVSRPDHIIHSPTDADVLRVLVGAHGSLTGRQVARLVDDGSQTTVLRSLQRLAQLGVIDVVEAGRALMYSLNRDHLATPALVHLASMRRRFLDGVGEALSDLDPPPASATLFGSAARGDGDASSDIDLLIVREDDVDQPTWDRQIDAVAERIRRMTGNPVSVHQIARSDVERLATERPAIVAELERDAIPVLGEPVDALIRTAATP